MGVSNLEVGYTSAVPRREDHEVHKDMWGIWQNKIGLYVFLKIIYYWLKTI